MSISRTCDVFRRQLDLPFREQGATAVEYALMMSFIAAVIIGGVAALGGTTVSLFMMAVASFP